MEVAEELFAEKGFNGTPVRDISEAAQVNLAMISYYFGSKEGLLEALFKYRGELAKIKLEGIVNQTGLNSLDKVYLLVDHYINKILNQQCFHRILTREQVLNNTGPLSALILDMKKTNFEIISRLIRDGQEKGEFRKDIDIQMMMATMVGTATNLITAKQYYKEMNNLQSLSEAELQENIREKLSKHLKTLFKIILTHDV